MKYQFINFCFISYPDLDNLPQWQFAQLMDLSERCFGFKAEHPSEILDETYDGNCDFWQIVASDQPDKVLYDCWIFNVDTAVVFHTQTTKDAGICMIQYYFVPSEEIRMSNEERAAMEVLSEDIQAAYRSAQRPEIPHQPNSPAQAYRDALKDVTDKEE